MTKFWKFHLSCCKTKFHRIFSELYTSYFYAYSNKMQHQTDQFGDLWWSLNIFYNSPATATVSEEPKTWICRTRRHLPSWRIKLAIFLEVVIRLETHDHWFKINHRVGWHFNKDMIKLGFKYFCICNISFKLFVSIWYYLTFQKLSQTIFDYTCLV